MHHNSHNLIFSHKNCDMAELKWSYEEFMCYVMIYVSHSDMEFTQEEKTKIVNAYGQDTFEKQFAVFDTLNDFQALNKITEYKEAFIASPEAKADLLAKIKDQLFVDGYTDFEKEVYHFLEKLL